MKHTNILFEKMIDVIKMSKFFNPQSTEVLKSDYLFKRKIGTVHFSLKFKKACELLYIKDLINLVNTKPNEFIGVNNCTSITIEKARQVLINAFYSKYKSSAKSLLDLELYSNRNKYPFFNFPINDLPEHNYSASLKELNFKIRFTQFLKSHKEIKTIQDLLGINIIDLIKSDNIGKTSIRHAQLLIYNHLTSKANPENLEEKILKRLIVEYKYQKNLNLFLEYYNYFSTKKTTLFKMHKRVKVSRQRIQQVVGYGKKKIFKNKDILKEIYDDLSNRSIVIDVNSYLTDLIQRKEISKSKRLFFYNMIVNSIIYNNDFKLEDNYIYPVNNITYFSKINDFIKGYINNEPILVDKLIEITSKEFKDQPPNSVNKETLEFLAFKYKNFYIVDKYVYNRLMYNLILSRKLEDVAHSAMILIKKPTHYRELATYIRENNKARKRTSDESLLHALNKSDKFVRTQWGVYSLRKRGARKYISAIDEIITLLNEKGTLSGREIYSALSKTHTEKNISAALKVNINKKLKLVGDNLYALK